MFPADTSYYCSSFLHVNLKNFLEIFPGRSGSMVDGFMDEWVGGWVGLWVGIRSGYRSAFFFILVYSSALLCSALLFILFFMFPLLPFFLLLFSPDLFLFRSLFYFCLFLLVFFSFSFSRRLSFVFPCVFVFSLIFSSCFVYISFLPLPRYICVCCLRLVSSFHAARPHAFSCVII